MKFFGLLTVASLGLVAALPKGGHRSAEIRFDKKVDFEFDINVDGDAATTTVKTPQGVPLPGFRPIDPNKMKFVPYEPKPPMQMNLPMPLVIKLPPKVAQKPPKKNKLCRRSKSKNVCKQADKEEYKPKCAMMRSAADIIAAAITSPNQPDCKKRQDILKRNIYRINARAGVLLGKYDNDMARTLLGEKVIDPACLNPNLSCDTTEVRMKCIRDAVETLSNTPFIGVQSNLFSTQKDRDKFTKQLIDFTASAERHLVRDKCNGDDKFCNRTSLQQNPPPVPCVPVDPCAALTKAPTTTTTEAPTTTEEPTTTTTEATTTTTEEPTTTTEEPTTTTTTEATTTTEEPTTTTTEATTTTEEPTTTEATTTTEEPTTTTTTEAPTTTVEPTTTTRPIPIINSTNSINISNMTNLFQP